jgi:hypothetical protein
MEANQQELEQSSSSTTNRLVEYAFTGLSSALFALTLPFSLFFAVKVKPKEALKVFILSQFVGPSERLVVMRLGRTRGVYGQGTVLLLPLVDKATTVDLRSYSSCFSRSKSNFHANQAVQRGVAAHSRAHRRPWTARSCGRGIRKG